MENFKGLNRLILRLDVFTTNKTNDAAPIKRAASQMNIFQRVLFKYPKV